MTVTARADGPGEDDPLDQTTEASELDKLWAEYKRTKDKHLREELIIRYSPLVKFVAGRVSSGLPNSIEQADLVSYGVFGLMDAIDRFDAGRNVKFETYAITRIKGAIIDELRQIDWVPRSVRNSARQIERALADLEASFGRSPTEAEVATELGITEDELANTLSKISYIGLVGLDEVISGGGDRGETVSLIETLPDRGDSPMAIFEQEEMRQILAKAINRLGEREKMVLTLYYFENLTLAQIGRVLSVTESRVCQIHTRAVMQLRARLGRGEE
jgi:RNA polymerase sigma factor for flagellar operon FliA